MVGIMVVMVTSFKKTDGQHTAAPRTVAVSVSDPKAGYCRLMPPPETSEHAQTGLSQSLVGSLLLSSGSWCTQDFVFF